MADDRNQDDPTGPITLQAMLGRLELPLTWALVALVAVTALLHVSVWVQRLAADEDVDYAEGWHIVCAQSCWPGETEVVSSVNEPPHNTLPYAPGGYLVNSLAGRLTGADDYAGYRRAARVVTFLASLFAVLLTAACAIALGVRPWIAMVTALLVINNAPVQVFAVNPRPDAIANCFNMLGLFLLIRFRSVIAPAVFFAAAILCKQSYVALTLATLGWMIYERRWRDALVFSATGIVSAALITWAGYALLGPHFLEGSMLQSLAGADFKAALFFLGQSLPWCAVLFAFAIVYPFVAGAGSNPRVMPIFVAFLLALVFNSVAIAKPGAYTDYLLEPLTLGAVVAACTWEQLARSLSSAAHRTAIVVLCLLCVFPFSIRLADEALEHSRSEAVVRTELPEFVRGLDGPILSDTSWVYREGEKPYWNTPCDLTTTAFESGKLDAEPSRKMIAEHYFSAVVVMPTWKGSMGFPAIWKHQIEESYQLSKEVDGYQVYLPRDEKAAEPSE